MTVGASPISPATRRSILLLSFVAFCSMATQRICDAMLPELARVFDASLAQAARVVSAFAVVYGLSQLIYGPLGDRLGKFRVVSCAAAWCALGNLLAMLAPSLDLLVAARVMVALGAAAIIPMCMALTGDAAPPDRLQETLARVGLGTTLGIVGGQLMGGLFTDTLGWRWAFGFMALLFGVVAGLLLADWRRQQAATAMAPRLGFTSTRLPVADPVVSQLRRNHHPEMRAAPANAIIAPRRERRRSSSKATGGRKARKYAFVINAAPNASASHTPRPSTPASTSSASNTTSAPSPIARPSLATWVAV